MFKKIALLALFIPTASIAAPQHFSDVTSLMSEYNDYSPDIGTFKVLSEKPLKIQISPKVLSGDSDESIKLNIYKASVYAAYRTLLQTSSDKVNVTVVPLFFDSAKHEKKYLTAQKISFSLTKEKALQLAGKAGGTDSPDAIISDDGEWTNNFSACCYRETGKPGLVAFAKELMK